MPLEVQLDREAEVVVMAVVAVSVVVMGGQGEGEGVVVGVGEVPEVLEGLRRIDGRAAEAHVMDRGRAAELYSCLRLRIQSS